MKWIIKVHATGRAPEYVRRHSPTEPKGAIDFTDQPDSARIFRDDRHISAGQFLYVIEELLSARDITRIELLSEKADPTIGQQPLELFKSK